MHHAFFYTSGSAQLTENESSFVENIQLKIHDTMLFIYNSLWSEFSEVPL